MGSGRAVAAFELDADLIAELAPGPSVPGCVRFPAVIRTWQSWLTRKCLPRGREAVREGGGELLAAVRLFDVYRGEQVGEGNKSLALRLEFRSPDRTLTDDEVAERRAAIERARDDRRALRA